MSTPPPRIYHPVPLPAPEETSALDPETSHHARVLRLGEGATVVLFDGAGHEAPGVVDSIGPRGRGRDAPVRVRTTGPTRPAATRTTPALSLVQALPKAGKIDGIVRMATEVGVRQVHLATSERTQGSGAFGEPKVDRLRRVAREAARQSGSAFLPTVEAPALLLDAAARAPAHAMRFVAWEVVAGRDDVTPLPGVAPGPLPTGGGDAPEPEAWVVVGPEGGLADAEVEGLRRLGYGIIGLGPTILRVETAAPVALALVADRFRWRDGGRP